MAKPGNKSAAGSIAVEPLGFGTEVEHARFGLKLSLIAHAVILVFLIIKGLVFPGKPIPYIPALRVDMVALPDILKKDLSKLSKIPAPPDIEKALKDVEEKTKDLPDKVTKDKAPPKAEDEVGLKKKQSVAREKKLKSALER